MLLTGETASGKSDLAVVLAERFDAEIIGADSRQIYRGMPIGTAAPTLEQRARIPHHLVECIDPFERYSAARYVEETLRLINEIHARGKHVVVAGGTGFYIRALCGDVDLGPQVDLLARERMHREAHLHEPEFLYEWLRLRNPVRAAELASGDTYRVTRALETVLASPALEPQGVHQNLRSRPIPFIKIWLQSDRDVLATRIERRVDHMLAAGFIEEAERIGADAVAANAVGYPQALAYLAGQMNKAELRALMTRTTRRYAKRQATWLRSEPGLIAIAASSDSTNEICRLLANYLHW